MRVEEPKPLSAVDQLVSFAPEQATHEQPPTDTAEASASPCVVVVMPAYNAAKPLERTYRDIPHTFVSRIILVDDVSRDDTVAVAHQLGLDVLIHRQNLGYGGNQKTCYDAALAAGADAVVMLHPDYQYDATCIPALVKRPVKAIGQSVRADIGDRTARRRSG